MRGVAGLVAAAAVDRQAPVADTLEGPWADAAIGAAGQLAFLKGDRMLAVAYATSSTDAAGVVRLARAAVGRL